MKLFCDARVRNLMKTDRENTKNEPENVISSYDEENSRNENSWLGIPGNVLITGLPVGDVSILEIRQFSK